MSDDTLKGVKVGGINGDGVEVVAPHEHATDEQWMDFAKVLGAGAYELQCRGGVFRTSDASVVGAVRDWSRRIAEAYNGKWGESGGDEGHVILTSAPGADQ